MDDLRSIQTRDRDGPILCSGADFDVVLPLNALVFPKPENLFKPVARRVIVAGKETAMITAIDPKSTEIMRCSGLPCKCLTWVTVA